MEDHGTTRDGLWGTDDFPELGESSNKQRGISFRKTRNRRKEISFKISAPPGILGESQRWWRENVLALGHDREPLLSFLLGHGMTLSKITHLPLSWHSDLGKGHAKADESCSVGSSSQGTRSS